MQRRFVRRSRAAFLCVAAALSPRRASAAIDSLIKAAIFAMGVLPLTVMAADRHWTFPASSGYWDAASNWDPAGQPRDGDVAYFTGTGGTYTLIYRNAISPPPRVTFILTATQGSLTLSQAQDTFSADFESIDGRAGGSGTFMQSGGTNALTGDLTLANYADATGRYLLSGGSLSSRYQYIGNQGVATFTQTSGTNAASNISLGGLAGSNGTYTLSGGMVTGFDEFIGSSGVGDFRQSDGTNSFNGLRLAVEPGARGTYEFTGGTLSGVYTRVGEAGPGTFVQTGGTHTLNSYLQVAAGAGESSSYSLGNGATLAAHDEFVGDSGIGTFTQDGGSNTVTGQLLIGKTTGDGTYALQAGTLSTFDLSIGTGGTGKLVQSAGSLTVGHLLAVLGDPANGRRASFELHGGGVNAPAWLNRDTFVETGGTATFGAVSGTGTLTVNGGTFTAASISQGTLSIGGSGSVVLLPGMRSNAQVNTVSALHFDAGAQAGSFAGTLDVANNTLLITYGSGPSPDAAVRSYLISGMRAFDHAGITSSTVAGDPVHYALGYADGADGTVVGLAAGQELVKFTLVGDATLNGAVGFDDLVILARNYGRANASWGQGDFNYDGKVGFDDLVALARNYGDTLTAAQLGQLDPAFRADVLQAFAEVPEPPSSELVLLAAVAVFHRLRRR